MADDKSKPKVVRVDDPYGGFRFQATFAEAGGTLAGFSDVTGLTVENEVETLREGGANHADVMLPGAAKFPARLVLKRGLADNSVLWNWYQKILAGQIERSSVTIKAVREDGSSGLQWTFHDACPVKWIGPEFHAGTGGVAFESIELIHRGLLPQAA